MTDPSSLNRRVTIQQEVLIKDELGGASSSWSDLATVWASVEPMTGKEGYSWGRLLGESTYVVRMRYRSGIKPKMRLQYGTRTFDVTSVIDEHEARRYLILGCVERA